MNETILADIDFAKKVYPVVLHELRKYYYNQFIRNFAFFSVDTTIRLKFQKLLNKLHVITEKDIAIINSYIDGHGWTSNNIEENFQNLSFLISLPEPKIIKNISMEDIHEINEIVKSENYAIYASHYIEHRFSIQLNDYFQELLEINLKNLLNNSLSIVV